MVVRLRKDPGGAGYQLAFPTPRGGEVVHACNLEICANPSCYCGSVELKVRPPADDRVPAQDDLRPLCFDLDPFERVFVANPDLPRNAPSQQLGRDVGAQLAAADWKELERLVLEAKNRGLESLDPDAHTTGFPFEAIEAEGRLVAWHDVFPFSPRIEVECRARRYLLDEKHCPREECSCAYVLLAFIPWTGSRRPARERDVVLEVNCVTGDWSAPGGTPWTGGQTRIRDEALAAVPDLVARLRSHHEMLRRVYRASLAAYRGKQAKEARVSAPPPDPSPPARPATGRNEPCPCGSGRKSKRCCGARA